jgi:ATP-binding cassette subfamily F protein 3
MISLKNITVEFGGTVLLDSISFLINKQDKLGLVGRNGSGKTTLMRLLMNIQSPTSGVIEMPKNIEIGYLPQEKIFSGSNSVFNEALTAFHEELFLRNEIASLQKHIEQPSGVTENQMLQFFEKYNELNERYNFLDGSTIEMRAERILQGLGFDRNEFHTPMDTLSEGWQMRVELAKILLSHSDILLLDEPTNHLDIESIQWLEDYLVQYPGAIILVSHDRMFLDKVTNRTVEINLGSVYDYPVSYSKYVDLRDERISLQKKQYQSQQKEIEQIEKFISRFRYKATKAKQVQSRIKLLNKMDVTEIDEINTAEMTFRFPFCKPSGKIVVDASGLTKNYDSHIVFKNIEFIISSGQKVAFVGKNGQGKTTLSRIIVNEIEYHGTMQLGHNVVIGYFPQNSGKHLDPKLTVLETIEGFAHQDYLGSVRSILGNFLFSGDDVHKKVAVLSGGEKSRLSLACLMSRPTNTLVLDEPTNHLDMLSKEVLKYALINYKGTLVIVSHDRAFLQDLTDTVFYFTKQTVKQYPGTLDEFLYLKKMQDIKEIEQTSIHAKKTSNNSKTVSGNKLLWQQKKEDERTVRKLKNQIQKIEIEIEDVEKILRSTEQQINTIQENFTQSEIDGIFDRYKINKEKMSSLLTEWETLASQLSEIEQKVEQYS